jgi:hypothetical protein
VREPLEPNRETYERPNQNWICGQSEEGPPCPLGPTGYGYCSQSAACHPIREGDRWVCNRSPQRGGTCEAGPTPDGECCLHYSCTPVRSLRSQRTRFVRALILATVGGLCMLLSSNWRNDFLAPGELTVHHAQLVARGDNQANRCASCHAAGNQSAFEWLSHATNADPALPSQSDLCLKCHDKEMKRETALLAHNFDPGFLTATHEVDFAARRVDPSGNFQCSICHREHHGAAHDLKAMSDSACQACHKQEFHGFATDHPQFDTWPERRRTRIAFDHSSHQAKHFPAEKGEFACTTCHRPNEDGSFQQTLGFEQSCAKCHDSDIQTSWEAGVPLVSLPMLDSDAFKDADIDIGFWPEAATGDFDGALPLVAKFLLLSDEKAVQALEVLGPDFDFYDVDPTDAKQLAAAADVVNSVKQLATELAQQGHAAFATRLERIVGRKLSAEQLAAVTAHLSSDNLTGLAGWFVEVAAPADDTVLSKESIAGGGWLRDDESLSLRYRTTGHADAWQAAWITLMAEGTHGPQQKIAESLLSQIMKPTAPGMCGSCHSVDRVADGSLHVNWFAKRSPQSNSITVFSHAPHVLQTQLADCTACHRMNETAPSMESYQQQDPHRFVAGFHQLTKQDCTTCHKPGAAGDSCTQCHKYHVGTQTDSRLLGQSP